VLNPAPAPATLVAQRQTSGAKDAVTAAARPRVWATVGQGIVNEVFWPAADQPQLKDLGFLLRTAEGEQTVWVEVKAEAAYTVTRDADVAVPIATIEHTGAFYRLAFTVLPDPNHDAILIDFRLTRLDGQQAQPVQLYALLAPRLGYSTSSARATGPDGRCHLGEDNYAWVQDGALFASTPQQEHSSALCLMAQPGFARASAGYVGSSDGWTDLHDDNAMTWTYDSAGPGVVALTGELLAPSGELAGALALGFGATPEVAGTAAQQALAQGAPATRAQVAAEWLQWSSTLRLPGTRDGLSADAADAVRQSASVLRLCRDPGTGGVIAGLSTPWGDATNAVDGYHLVWCRDGSETALALAALGDTATGYELLRFLQTHQVAGGPDDGSWGRCYFLDGSTLPGLQLDETAFPILLAAKFAELGAAVPDGIADVVRRAAGYLARFGPVYAEDRWEESPGGSPYTIAVIICALVAGTPYLDAAEQAYALSLADNWNERLEDFCYIAGTGIDRTYGVDGHYVRLGRPLMPVHLGNQLDPNASLPAEFMVGLECFYLARLGLRRPGDKRLTDTATVIDHMLQTATDAGDVYLRYDVDGYGEWLDGSGWPVHNFGVGRPWPLLAGERGHFDVLGGGTAGPWLETMLACRGRGGLLPEQVWDAGDLPWRNLFNGHPTGSAMPLAWAHSELIKLALLAGTGAGRPVERLAAVEQRYPHAQTPQSAVWHWRDWADFASAPDGVALQVEERDPFVLHYGFDGWQSVDEVEASPLPFGLWGVRLEPSMLAGHTQLNFTRRQPDWEGQDHTITLTHPSGRQSALPTPRSELHRNLPSRPQRFAAPAHR
jgi:glucoamylase